MLPYSIQAQLILPSAPRLEDNAFPARIIFVVLCRTALHNPGLYIYISIAKLQFEHHFARLSQVKGLVQTDMDLSRR